MLATFTVNSLGDAGGFPVPGSRTLRQAILSANARAGADIIVFAFPTTSESVISPGSPLPAITDAVTIDGPGNPLDRAVNIRIDGNSAGASTSGLLVQASNVVIRRIAVTRFAQNGIEIQSGTNNVVSACLIGGAARNGTMAAGNGLDGIVVLSGGNTIGALRNAEGGNTVVANVRHGIRVTNELNPTVGNVIIGNSIGVPAITASFGALGNGGDGIALEGGHNRVGAVNSAQGGAEARNVISGNARYGVRIEQSYRIDSADGVILGPDAVENVVAGNYIGTNFNGTIAVPNGVHGVQVRNAQRNTIGAADPLGRNIISGNTRRGVNITALSSTSGSFTFVGNSRDNVVIGNYVGLTPNGTPLGNGRSGVAVEVDPSSATGFTLANRIGGSAAGEGNIISSNASPGVSLANGSTTTTIAGNFIGLDPTGNAARPNNEAGVSIIDSSSNTVGGMLSSARNVISGNTGDGVRILRTSAAFTSTANKVLSNFIGTNAAGDAAVGNTQYGVRLVATSSNQIGDSSLVNGSAGNVISGNGMAGVGIGFAPTGFTPSGLTSSNVIQNNFIGSNANVTADLGNGGGIIVGGTQANQTLGTVVGGAGNGVNRRGNLVVGSAGLPGGPSGGIIVQPNASGTSILGNYIGTNSAANARLGTLGNPMVISGPNTTVGSTGISGGNVIGFGNGPGIILAGGASNVTLVANGIGTNLNGTAILGNGDSGIYVDPGFTGADLNITIGGTTTNSPNRIANNGAAGIAVYNGRGVEILGNRITNNGGLGIDLGGNGVTPNDFKDADTGANDLQNFPTVSLVTVSGQDVSIPVGINSSPNTPLRFDFYAVVGAADPTNYGEGAVYLGSVDATTNAAGNAGFVRSFSLASAPGATAITATATRLSDGSTSEFSRNASLADVVPPTVIDFDFFYQNRQSVLLEFSEYVSGSLTASDVLVENLTTGLVVPAANISITYFDPVDPWAEFFFTGYPNGILPDGNYRFTVIADGVTDAAGNRLDGDNNGTAGGNYANEFYVLAGDANRDRVVDVSDLGVLSANFRATGRDFTQGDFNYDGVVDVSDLGILSANFRRTLTAPVPIATPIATATPLTAGPFSRTRIPFIPGLLIEPDLPGLMALLA